MKTLVEGEIRLAILSHRQPMRIKNHKSRKIGSASTQIAEKIKLSGGRESQGWAMDCAQALSRMIDMKTFLKSLLWFAVVLVADVTCGQSEAPTFAQNPALSPALTPNY